MSMKIKDLFDYKYGVNLELMNCQETPNKDKDSVNFVARTSMNNGVVARVKIIEGLTPQRAGTLSLAVSGSVLSCFVQTEDYYSGRDLYVLTPKINLTLEQKLFYAMCINKNAYRYSYGRAANKTFPNIEIPNLNLCNEIINNFKLKKIITKNHNIQMTLNTTNWKEYKLSDLFKQNRGCEKAPNQNENGLIKCINEIDSNNGFTRMVEPTKIFAGNAITISINFAKNVFYQPDEFCASVNIAIIRNKEINKYNGLFIVSILRKLYEKYSYGYKISKEKINNTIIKLPSVNNEPDWQFMENYIKSLPYGDRI